ncbi:MAG TPA: co-chaperone GroES, partial [Firmicutes bacterium]|nr:co-chaperone GroES [Bacillota bacterium]
GMVIAVGAGRIDDKGQRVVPEVKVGEKVIYASYAGTEFKNDGTKLLILKESDILAILE